LNRAERKEWYYYEIHKIIDGIVYRQCSQCNEWKIENEEFYLHNKSKPEKGFQSECKECAIKRAVKRQNEHIQEHNVYTLNRYHTIPRVKEIKKRAAQKARINGKQREWRERNSDKVNQYSAYRNSHKKHNINNKEWIRCKQYFDNSCAYCGLPIEEHYNMFKGEPRKEDLQKEHVDHFGNNTLDNCVPTCKSCNCKKHTMSLDEWYNQDNENFTQERYDKIIQWINEGYKNVN
jgi:hypothetical protein